MQLGHLALALASGCGGLASAKQTIWLNGLLPLSGRRANGLSQIIAGKIMLEQLNAHSSLLRDYELKIVWQDAMCSSDEGSRIIHANFFREEYFAFAPDVGIGDLDVDGDGAIEREDTLPLSQVWNESHVSPRPVGILGPGCSGVALAITPLAHYFNYVVVSSSATFSFLSDRTEFPNFFRTAMPDTLFSSAWVAMAKMLGQTSMIVVIGEMDIWARMGQRMMLAAEAGGVSLVGQDLSSELAGFRGIKLSADSAAAARGVAALLVRYKLRIISLLLYAARNALLLCESYKLGFRNAVFMPFAWLIEGWWAAPGTTCTPQQVTSMARGFIGADMAYWRYDEDTVLSCSENMTAREFREEWFRRQGADFGDYSFRPEGFPVSNRAACLVDAICTYALALDTLLAGRGLQLEELTGHTDRAYNELREVMQASDFEGLNGRLTFEPGSPDPLGSTLLRQLHVHPDGSSGLVDIATFTDGALRFLGKADLVFGLPGEQAFAGSAGASAVSLKLAAFAVCGKEQTLDMERNECVGCPLGTIYMDVLQDCVCRKGYARTNGTCTPCGPGKAAPEEAQAMCTSCPVGSYSADPSNEACHKCPPGQFQAETGSSKCTSCESELGNGMTTDMPGSTTKLECRCSSGTFQDAQSRACRACPKGMECPFGSDMAPNASVKPLLLPMYWSDVRDPLNVFRCENAFRCPGHHFGACAPHARARACAHCEEAWAWDGVQCAPCSSFSSSGLLFPVLPLLLSPFLICGLYVLFGGGHARLGSWQNGLGATAFILLTYVQIAALMQSIELDMPEAAARFFERVAFANDLMKAFSPHCSGFSGVRTLQAIAVTAPAIVLLVALLCWLSALGLSRLTGRRWLKMEPNRTWNVAMFLIYTFFTSIVTSTCSLFKCGSNPNGTQSLVSDRSIVCFRGEWLDLLAVEVVGVLIWCFGVVCLFSRVVFFSTIPKSPDNGMQMRWKFLFSKYRPDVHWWSLVFMARAVLLNVGLIAVQESASKLFFIMAVNMLYLGLLSIWRPWRHRVNNLVDGFGQLSLVALASLLTTFTIATTDLAYTMGQVTFAAFVVCLALSAVLGCSIVWSQRQRESPAVREEVLRDVRFAFGSLERAGTREIEKFVGNLDEWDTNQMRMAKDIILTEFCKVSSRQGLSTHSLSRRVGSPKNSTRPMSTWRGAIDWDAVDANIGVCRMASFGSSDALPNHVTQALELIHGVSRAEG